jgi:hypothetical protein
MAGLGVFILIVGVIIMLGGILAEEMGPTLIGFAMLLGGGVMKEYADSHNPVIVEQRKQEQLRDEIKRIESKRNTWKYYQKLKKGNSKLQDKLKHLKKEESWR